MVRHELAERLRSDGFEREARYLESANLIADYRKPREGFDNETIEANEGVNTSQKSDDTGFAARLNTLLAED